MVCLKTSKGHASETLKIGSKIQGPTGPADMALLGVYSFFYASKPQLRHSLGTGKSIFHVKTRPKKQEHLLV
jgi:hypothetical protein